MESQLSDRNLFLISASSIFYWLGLRMIQDFYVRLIRDILVYYGSNSILIYIIGVIIEISIIIYGLLYLYKQLKAEKNFDVKLFKTSLIIMIVGYLLNFINPFLYNIIDMNVYNSNFRNYIEFYSSIYVSIIQFIVEILPIIFIGYLVSKSKSQFKI